MWCELRTSASDQYERPLFLVYCKSFVSTMITLKHVAARVLSPSCYAESLRLHCSNVFDGASYAVTEVLLCTLLVNGCSLLNVFGHGVRSGPLLHCKRCRH